MNFVRRYRLRPNNSIGVIAYLRYCAHQSADSDAVTTHQYKLFLSTFVGELQIKGLGKFCFQAEDIAYFYGFIFLQIFVSALGQAGVSPAISLFIATSHLSQTYIISPASVTV